MKLTQNADTYRCSCYGTGFDARLQFSLSIDAWGKNVVIFGRNNSSSWHTDKRKKKILIIVEGKTHGLDNMTIMMLYIVTVLSR